MNRIGLLYFFSQPISYPDIERRCLRRVKNCCEKIFIVKVVKNWKGFCRFGLPLLLNWGKLREKRPGCKPWNGGKLYTLKLVIINFWASECNNTNIETIIHPEMRGNLYTLKLSENGNKYLFRSLWMQKNQFWENYTPQNGGQITEPDTERKLSPLKR